MARDATAPSRRKKRPREQETQASSVNAADNAAHALLSAVSATSAVFIASGRPTAPGSCSTAPGAFLRLREAFLRLRELFYGSGKLSTAPGSFSTAPGSFSTAPGSCLRLREAFLRLREAFLRLREVVYGSGQAARRACLLPRSSTNSSKNNLTVWAAGGRRRGIYGLYSPRHQIRANRSALRTTWMSNGVLVAYFTICHLYSDSVWTAHTRTSTWERSHIFAFQSAFPCPLPIFGQNEVRCEPRECSMVETMCISPPTTSTPTRIRPNTFTF